jgi:LmbE family N-acetylglucosaminyl deacetylase
VLVAASLAPDTWIDITATLDLKLEALRQHASQFSDDWDPGDMVRQWATEHGANIGVPYAEAFKRIVLVREDNEVAGLD